MKLLFYKRIRQAVRDAPRSVDPTGTQSVTCSVEGLVFKKMKKDRKLAIDINPGANDIQRTRLSKVPCSAVSDIRIDIINLLKSRPSSQQLLTRS